MSLTATQVKMARAALDWSREQLAEASGVSVPAIRELEAGRVQPRETTLTSLKQVFEIEGIEFLQSDGVRRKDDLLTIIEKMTNEDNVYLKLLDDVYYTLRNKGGELLHSFIDNSLSPHEVIRRELDIRACGVQVRSLVRYGDTYLLFPIKEYRYLPEDKFHNNSMMVYGDKFAVMIDGDRKAIIINNKSIADIKRAEFNLIWDNCIPAKESTAQKVYHDW